MDFKIMTKAIFPNRANYVVAIDGFIGRGWLLRAVGCICNRKFVKSVNLVKNMIHAKDNGDIVVLFAEARYSLCGTTAPLPKSLGKMARMMNVPVVMLLMHGHHINSPFWNTGNRRVKPTEAEMKLLFTKEETQNLTIDELNKQITEAFKYDEYVWQREKGIKVTKQNRAEGLHKVLYQCSACKEEYKMASYGSMLYCENCGKIWKMSELGTLKAETGETEFSHIPDWYEWERKNVKNEIRKGTYWFKSKVRVESLPNDKKFIIFDEPGHLIHDMDGFKLTGSYNNEPYEITWKAPSLYSCHIEYNYMGRGDCVDLNTPDDTLYLFPEEGEYSVTKISLATEELYKRYSKN